MSPICSRSPISPHSSKREATGLLTNVIKMVRCNSFHSCIGILPEVFYQLHKMLFFVYPLKSRHGKLHLYVDEQPDGRGFSRIFYFYRVRQLIFRWVRFPTAFLLLKILYKNTFSHTLSSKLYKKQTNQPTVIYLCLYTEAIREIQILTFTQSSYCPPIINYCLEIKRDNMHMKN